MKKNQLRFIKIIRKLSCFYSINTKTKKYNIQRIYISNSYSIYYIYIYIYIYISYFHSNEYKFRKTDFNIVLNLQNSIKSILNPRGGMKVRNGNSHINCTNFSVGTGCLRLVFNGDINIVTDKIIICRYGICI